MTNGRTVTLMSTLTGEARRAAAAPTLQQQLSEITNELRGAYSRFALASEPELIEAEIYRIKCLEARRSHLLRRARENADG